MSNKLTINNIEKACHACRTYAHDNFYNFHCGEDRDLYWIYFECRTNDGIKIKECRVNISRYIQHISPDWIRCVTIGFNTNEIVDGSTNPIAHTRRFNIPISKLKNYVRLVSEILNMAGVEDYIPRGV